MDDEDQRQVCTNCEHRIEDGQAHVAWPEVGFFHVCCYVEDEVDRALCPVHCVALQPLGDQIGLCKNPLAGRECNQFYFLHPLVVAA